MVDPTAAVIVSIVAGIAGGFLSSWMAFNASGEQFNGRKHGNALITGGLAGMAIGVAQSVVNPEEIPVNQFVISTFLTFLAAAGIDRLRSSGSHMTAKSIAEKIEEDKPAALAPPKPEEKTS